MPQIKKKKGPWTTIRMWRLLNSPLKRQQPLRTLDHQSELPGRKLKPLTTELLEMKKELAGFCKEKNGESQCPYSGECGELDKYFEEEAAND